MSRFHRFALCVVFLLPVFGFANAPRPNVIIVYTDDQHRSEFGYEGGHNATPNIDRLANDGLIFDHFYISTALCAPSRVALQTGRYPSASPPLLRSMPVDRDTNSDGQPDPPYVLQTLGDEEDRPAETFNLPYTLQQAGYSTGIVGKWHLGFLGTRQRPASNRSQLLHNFNLTQQAAYAAGYDYAEALYHDNVQPDNFADRYMAHNPEWITWKAREFIEAEANDSEPFFLVVNPTLPHWPQADDSRFDSLNADKALTGIGDRTDALALPPGDPVREEILAIGDETYDSDGKGLLSGMPARSTIVPRAQASGFDGGYREDIVWLDDIVGSLVDKVEELGLQNDTLIFVISDHGRAGKWTNQDKGISSGALAHWPGQIPAGSFSSDLISNVDIAPTLFELAGATPAPDADLHGVSIAGHLFDAANVPSGRPYAYSEIGYERTITRADGMKLVVSYGDGDIRSGNLGADWTDPIIKLYDMQDAVDTKVWVDRWEEVDNVVNDPAYADTLDEMKDLLREQSLRLPHEFGEFTQGEFAPIVTSAPASITVDTGEDATFSVTAEGLPFPSYQWYVDGVPTGADEPTLTLPAVTVNEDGAQITVEVTNTVGSANTSTTPAILTVLPPPDAPPAVPSGLTASVLGFSEIELNWVDESTTESGFKIECRSGTDPFTEVATVGEDVTTWTHSGRATATTYIYRIRSTNLAGDSAYAPAAIARTPEAPVGGDLLQSSATASFSTAGETSQIDNVTVPSLANGALVVSIGAEGPNPNSGPASVSFAGQELTQAVESENAATHSSVWYLVNPPVTTDAINITWASSQFGTSSLAYFVLSGVDPDSPVAAVDQQSAGGGSTGLSATLTGAPDSAIAIDALATNNNVASSVAFGAGQTEAWTFGGIGGGATHAASYEENAGANAVQSVSWSSGQRATYAAAAFARAPAPVTTDAFAGWAGDSGLDGSEGHESGRFDNPDYDILDNVYEWVLALNPLVVDAPATYTMTAQNDYTVSFQREDSSEDWALIEVEFSNDLFENDIRRVIVGPNSTTEVDGMTVTVTENGDAPDDIAVSVSETLIDSESAYFSRFRLHIVEP